MSDLDLINRTIIDARRERARFIAGLFGRLMARLSGRAAEADRLARRG